jgi:hypothetical protein
MARKTQDTDSAARVESEGASASRKAAPSGLPEAAVFLEAGDAAAAAALKAVEAMIKGMASLQQEIAEFAGAEVRHGLTASNALRDCRDPATLFSLQCDFARQATQRHLEEAGKLMSLTARVLGECWRPFEECAAGALDRVTRR